MEFLLLVPILVATIIIGLILYARWNYGTLESLGIPVVQPLHFILGNTKDFHSTVSQLEDIRRFNKYGPVYGFYEGREPQIHICDAELIKHIMVKDYEHFKERRSIDFGSPLLNEMPAFTPYNKWKVLRQLLSPTFTASKIKLMGPSMKGSLVDFGDKLKMQISASKSATVEKCNIRQEIFTMLTDMIARCVFSINIEQKGDSDNHFVKIVKRLVGGDGDAGNNETTFIKSLTFSFPFLKKFAPIYHPQAAYDFVKTFKEILQVRKSRQEKKRDFVDSVMDWMDRLESEEFKTNDITELTLMAQALIFFFAGQDQTSTIVAFAILSVCKNREIEEKIYLEMDAFLEKHNGRIDHDNIGELTYLNAVVTEALRLVPFFHRSERKCTTDWEKDGLRIKKGMTVIIPLWAANRNPEYFPDPEEFIPDRFLPENKDKLHPYAMSSFGHGPKNCVGMRFGNDTLIFTAAYLYKDFRFKIRHDTDFKCYPGLQFNILHAPIYLDVSMK